MRQDIFVPGKNGQVTISMKKLLGGGYTDAWFTNNRVRYRLFCGARSTKKSKVIIGYEPIFKILSDSRRNVLIARQNDSDNRQSTFENITGCIIDLGLENAFKISKNPLTIEYRSTGQQIIFRGLNNPTSLNGITFAHGYFTDAYIDEAFEIPSFEDFRKLDGSIRGKLPDDLFFQITMCFNAWDGDSWLNEEFFKGHLDDDFETLDDPNTKYMDYKDEDYIGPYGRGLYLHKSTYKINDFRHPDYDLSAQEMKRKSLPIYCVEFLGMFGNTVGACYPEFSDAQVLPINAIVGRNQNNLPNMKFIEFAIGVDTGLSDNGTKITIGKHDDPNIKIRSATTMTLNALTSDYSKLVVIDEYFHSNIPSQNSWNTDNKENLGLPDMSDAIIKQIVSWINFYGNTGTGLMKGPIRIYVDNADVGFRSMLSMKAREYGLYNIEVYASKKLSLYTRVDFDRLLCAYNELLICDKCKNLIREFKAAKKGKKGEAREPGNDHTIDSYNYGANPLLNELKRWKTFKPH